MRAVDWLTRLVLLVLSSLATLALIGSLASVSNTPLGGIPFGEVARPAPDEDMVVIETMPVPPRSGQDAAAPDTGGAARAPAAASGGGETARWLEALTYAVLALAGFAAAGLVALLRIAHHLGRIAGR